MLDPHSSYEVLVEILYEMLCDLRADGWHLHFGTLRQDYSVWVFSHVVELM